MDVHRACRTKEQAKIATVREGRVAGCRIAALEDGPAADGRTCGFVWLGGFRSDMTGAKAGALAGLATETGRPCLRFDYSGHGASSGDFRDGTISRWLEEALVMVRDHARGPRILVGSSMGGWLAALLYRSLGEEARRIRGLILLAPAHDFTEELMWRDFSEETRRTIHEAGEWLRPSAYGEPIPITRALIEDGRLHRLLGHRFPVSCPVRILQGDADPDVPLSHAQRVFADLAGDDVTLTIVRGGDHRLSAPHELALLRAAALDLAGREP